MTVLAVVGVPRTEYVLRESVVQARLRGLDVLLVDDDAALSRVPATVPASGRIAADPRSPGLVARRLAEHRPGLVVSFTELHLVAAARVREELGLPGSPSAVEARVRDKAATRALLRDRGLSKVASQVCTLAELRAGSCALRPPMVIKPLDLTGGVGVRAVRTTAEIADYADLFADPRAEARGDRPLLVEEFIDGEEYSVEGLCVGGRFHLLAVTRKRTSGYPYFFETGHLLPARAPGGNDRLAAFLRAVTGALEIGTAPIHAEVKVTADAVELIEIHTRFGGDLIPLLMEKAARVKPFGLFYDALLYGTAPPSPLPARQVAAIAFLPPVAGDALRLPIPRECTGIELAVRPAGGPETLGNYRAPNPRAGHVIVTAADHDHAERVLTELTELYACP